MNSCGFALCWALHPEREGCVTKPPSALTHKLPAQWFTTCFPWKCSWKASWAEPVWGREMLSPAPKVYIYHRCAAHIWHQKGSGRRRRGRSVLPLWEAFSSVCHLKVLQSLEHPLHNCLAQTLLEFNTSSLWQRFQPRQDLKKAFNPSYFLFRLIALPNTYTSYKDNPSLPH